MYFNEERMRAVQLYIKYDCSPSAVIYELGYPSRNMITNWYKEYKETGMLRDNDYCRRSKFTFEQRMQRLVLQEHKNCI